MAEYLLLGLYAPIVVFSAYAVYMLIVRLLLPAFIARRLDIATYAIAISACLSLLAHVLENAWYGVMRWNAGLSAFNTAWPILSIWKVVILLSSFFAVLALQQTAPSARKIAGLSLLAITLWAGFSYLASIWL